MPRGPTRTTLASAPAAPSAPRPDAFWTAPNVVSLSRVVLAAAFVFTTEALTRAALVAAASLSDMLDGWLARRTNAVSRWGALIDPIADRIFALAAVVTLVVHGELTPAQFAVLLARDVMTAIGFLVARSVRWLRPAQFRARPLGKAVTALQLGALLAATLWRPALPGLVVGVGVTSALATADYTLLLWRERDRTLKP